MNFKIGQIAKIIDKKNGCLGGFSIGDKAEIIHFQKSDDRPYIVKNLRNGIIGYASESNLQSLEIEVGDTVRINKQATIEDFTKNHWNGCQMNTLDFIERYGDQDKEFIVKKVSNNCLKVSVFGQYVNLNIFELVEKKENVKEMTVSEIEKELGITGLRIKKED